MALSCSRFSTSMRLSPSASRSGSGALRLGVIGGEDGQAGDEAGQNQQHGQAGQSLGRRDRT